MSLSPFRQGYRPPGSETTKSPMRRNESLFFALLDTFPNWELLASCKHKRQPSESETGKVLLEAQLFHGKAIWSRAMSPKACLKCSFQNTFLDSFSQSQKGFNLYKALQNSAFEVGLILRSNCLFCDIHRDSKLCKFSGNLKSTLDSVLATFLFATLEATHTGK